MLFFYGTGTTTIGRYALPGLACAQCSRPNALSVTVFSRYVHFFWVPMLPIGKRGVSHCAHCQQTLPESQMPPAYRSPVRAARQTLATPVSNYLAPGLLLLSLAALVTAGAFNSLLRPGHPNFSVSTATSSGGRPADNPHAAPDRSTAASRAATQALLTDPHVGDLLVLRSLIDPRYSVMRLSRVGPDTVFFYIYGYRPPHLRNFTDFRAQQDSLRPSLDTLRQGAYLRASLVALAQSEVHIISVVRP